VVEVIRQAHRCEVVSCPVAVDALPQATSVYELAQAGRGLRRLGGSEGDTALAKSDLGATPTLFETAGSRGRSPLGSDEDALLRRKPSPEKQTAQRRGKAGG
jgi:hypothetical protein